MSGHCNQRCLGCNQELYAATFVRVETVDVLINMALHLFLATLRSSSFSGVVFDFHSMNASSLDLTATAQSY